MIILGCFGGTTIKGNTHIDYNLVNSPPPLPPKTLPSPHNSHPEFSEFSFDSKLPEQHQGNSSDDGFLETNLVKMLMSYFKTILSIQVVVSCWFFLKRSSIFHFHHWLAWRFYSRAQSGYYRGFGVTYLRPLFPRIIRDHHHWSLNPIFWYTTILHQRWYTNSGGHQFMWQISFMICIRS